MPAASPAIDRFWAKVDKAGPIMPGMSTRCWVWMASIDDNGYGLFRPDGKLIRAHIYSFELQNGAIVGQRRELFVCHRCDNPSCVRYDHLFRGTPRDNALDRDRKGRCVMPTDDKSRIAALPRGRDHHKAKLSEQQVIDIRTRRSTGETISSISAAFNVSEYAVWAIVHRKTWQHI